MVFLRVVIQLNRVKFTVFTLIVAIFRYPGRASPCFMECGRRPGIWCDDRTRAQYTG